MPVPSVIPKKGEAPDLGADGLRRERGAEDARGEEREEDGEERGAPARLRPEHAEREDGDGERRGAHARDGEEGDDRDPVAGEEVQHAGRDGEAVAEEATEQVRERQGQLGQLAGAPREGQQAEADHPARGDEEQDAGPGEELHGASDLRAAGTRPRPSCPPLRRRRATRRAISAHGCAASATPRADSSAGISFVSTTAICAPLTLRASSPAAFSASRTVPRAASSSSPVACTISSHVRSKTAGSATRDGLLRAPLGPLAED
jgi:hypothetical protein